MANQIEQLHFVLFPFMAQGHMIPMVDTARLLAQQGMIVTIVTTPKNAARFKKILGHAVESGLSIRLAELQFPCMESGLPEGCENFDMLPSLGLALKFFQAANRLEEPVQKLLQELRPPRPSCIISDVLLTYTLNIANIFQIPRVAFYSASCFCLLCIYNLRYSKIIERITSESHYFSLPNMPDKVEFTKLQLPGVVNDGELKEFCEQTVENDLASYGVIINTFEGLEPEYVREYRRARGYKVWCIGPVSLCNKDVLDKAERGNKASVDEHQCQRWLDSQEIGSVIYACLGSLSNVIPSQLIELGLGLEASNRPFIWVLRGSTNTSEVVEKWVLADGFEERIKGRGLLIWGWAPQVVLLSHPAIGGFLTHCGWNSTIEAITAGVPLITWPLFGDQFCNEKLVVQLLQIGVRIGVEKPMTWGEEEKAGVLVKKDDVKEAVERLMEVGMEEEERRKRAKKLAEMAEKALEVGGSSQLNITQFIQDIRQSSYDRKQPRI